MLRSGDCAAVWISFEQLWLSRSLVKCEVRLILLFLWKESVSNMFNLLEILPTPALEQGMYCTPMLDHSRSVVRYKLLKSTYVGTLTTKKYLRRYYLEYVAGNFRIDLLLICICAHLSASLECFRLMRNSDVSTTIPF